MPPLHRQIIGWTPSVDNDNPYEIYEHPSPCSPSSSSSLSEPDAYPPRSSGSSSRRHHEPGWVARPRNAFIIFRCEYSQTHCRQGRRIRRPPGTSTEPTLSKRAAVAWSQMSKEEKIPYKLRAEEERNEHARMYPDYRFRPQRRLGVGGRRYGTRHSVSHTAVVSYPSSGNLPGSRGSSVSSGTISSRPSTSDGSSPDLDFGHGGPLAGWSHPTLYNTHGIFVGDKLPPEIISSQAPDSPDLNMPDMHTVITIHNPTPTPASSPPLFLSWNEEPSSCVTTSDVEVLSPASTLSAVEANNYLPFPPADYEVPDAFFQYLNVDGMWSSHPVTEHLLGGPHDPPGCIPISNYSSLAGANVIGGANLSSKHLGSS